MKKIILFSTLCFFVTLKGFSYRLISRTTTGGLFGGYWSTSKELVEASDGKLGWVIECKNPGLTGCPNATKLVAIDNEPELEANDYSAVIKLLKIVDPIIGEGVPGSSGTESISVSVEGETYIRRYTIQWRVNDDGSTSTDIDRIDY